MSIWSWLQDRLRRDRDSRRLGEVDAPGDTGTARSRATGGVPDAEAQDRHSTTGTTPSSTFVGRVAGDDAGVGETTGAEKRAEAADREAHGGPAGAGTHADTGREREGEPPPAADGR